MLRQITVTIDINRFRKILINTLIQQSILTDYKRSCTRYFASYFVILFPILHHTYTILVTWLPYMLHSEVSSLSACTLQSTHSHIKCVMLNCFFGLSAYLTGNQSVPHWISHSATNFARVFSRQTWNIKRKVTLLKNTVFLVAAWIFSACSITFNSTLGTGRFIFRERHPRKWYLCSSGMLFSVDW